MTGAILDSGALIAFERGDRQLAAIVRRALDHGDPLIVPAGVVAQVWRDGRRQARLARLLGSDICTVAPLDDTTARATGQLLGISETADVVDASVAVLARRHGLGVITSDPDDIRRLDRTITVAVV